MRFSHLLPAILPLVASVLASPLPIDQDDEWIASLLSEAYAYESESIYPRDEDFRGSIDLKYFCDTNRTKLVQMAWNEAGQIARTFNDRDGFPHDYGRIMSAWLGPKWDSSGTENWLMPAPNYADRIHGNIRRAAEVFSNRAPRNLRIHVNCRLQQEACENDRNLAELQHGGTNADGQRIHFLHICPVFFTLTKPINQLLSRAQTDSQRSDMTYFKDSRGTVLFHEVMHMEYVGTEHIIDINGGYGLDAWCLARKSGTAYAERNADSYAMAATAMYVQKRNGHRVPPEYAVPAGSNMDLECKNQPVPAPLPHSPPKHVDLRDPESEENMTPGPMCNGLDDTRWVTYDAVNKVLPAFCAEADRQGVQDPGSGGFYRNYAFGDDQFQLGIDWQNGAPWKPTTDICTKFMHSILDGCDGLAPEVNPLNHKRGGYETFGIARFIIAPTKERYSTGTCSFHLHEREQIRGQNGPGTAEKHDYTVEIDMKDGAGQQMRSSGQQPAGDGHPYVYLGLYQLLEVTPEADNGNYIQFSLGEQSWTTKQTQGVPRCQVGAWAPMKPSFVFGKAQDRHMDCFFLC